MRRTLHYCAAFAFIVFTLASCDLVSQTPDARQQLLDISNANSLDIDGTQPWHLRMTFHLNDLNGLPKEVGTIEEWWLSPTSRRLEIKSPSYNLTIPDAPSTHPTHTRESYLVGELLDQIVHPIPNYGDFKALNVTEQSRTFGKTELTCISVGRASIKYSPSSPPPQFCVAPGTTVLRAHLDGAYFAAARNSMATFRGVSLGRDNTLTYGGHVAISGHLDTLESYHPDGSIVVTTPVAATTARIPNLVMAGTAIKKEAPEYPMIARRQHISGTVVLCAIISKQGTISALDVVSSPDSSLTESAIDAVKRWTYQPYLLNGEPTEVDTTITVNYNLN